MNATDRVAEWDEVYRLLRDAYPEIGHEALALTAATLLIPGGAPLRALRTPARAEFEEGRSTGASILPKVRPADALCATCGRPFGPKDDAAWDDSRGVWTHTIPTCLLPGVISADPVADYRAGRIALAGIIDVEG